MPERLDQADAAMARHRAMARHPKEDQDAMAAMILEELASDERCQQWLARAPELSKSLADEARADFEPIGRSRWMASGYEVAYDRTASQSIPTASCGVPTAGPGSFPPISARLASSEFAARSRGNGERRRRLKCEKERAGLE